MVGIGLGLSSLSAQTVILDFEDAATSTLFQYFGSPSQEGTFNEIIANPDPSGLNTSDSVAVQVKPSDAQTFAGGFTNPNPTTPVDLTAAGSQVCIKVWSPEANTNFLFKLEAGASDPDNDNYVWEQSQIIASASEWVELCFDPTVASENGNSVVASGETWGRVVVFFDFGEGGDPNGVTYYFDDITVQSTSSVDAVAAESIFSVAPSVIRESAEIRFAQQLQGTKRVSLFNLNGQVLRSMVVPAGQLSETLTVAGLNQGVYVLKVQSDNQVATRKVMVSR